MKDVWFAHTKRTDADMPFYEVYRGDRLIGTCNPYMDHLVFKTGRGNRLRRDGRERKFWQWQSVYPEGNSLHRLTRLQPSRRDCVFHLVKADDFHLEQKEQS